jgi:predicted DNA-binding ribbon-helix-helix protein
MQKEDKRVNVAIDEGLYWKLKKIAFQRRSKIRQLVAEAIEKFVAESRKAA